MLFDGYIFGATCKDNNYYHFAHSTLIKKKYWQVLDPVLFSRKKIGFLILIRQRRITVFSFNSLNFIIRTLMEKCLEYQFL